MHHLLKSPFFVHPKTGRVCVPIDPEQVDEFDPFSVPVSCLMIEEKLATALVCYKSDLLSFFVDSQYPDQ